MRRLEGDWVPVQLVTDGQPLADHLLAFGSRTCVGNEVKMVFGGREGHHQPWHDGGERRGGAIPDGTRTAPAGQSRGRRGWHAQPVAAKELIPRARPSNDRSR
jgi:hypothetical protein